MFNNTPIAPILRFITNIKGFMISLIPMGLTIEQQLRELRKNKLIRRVERKGYDRIHIITRNLYVQLEGKNKVVGQFEIVIDLGKSYEPVRILNLSQRYGDLDSPTVRHTRSCWGTIEHEINSLWRRSNIVGLVDTVLYYIVSPKDGHGYGKWASWFKFAKPVKRGYSMNKFDAGMSDIQQAPGLQIPTAAGNIRYQSSDPMVAEYINRLYQQKASQEQIEAFLHQAATRNANGEYII